MKYRGLLKRGATGKQVSAVQKKLREFGYQFIGWRGKELIADGDFGPLTEEAVSEFQMQNTDRAGNPLVVDGTVGPLTWEALFGEPEAPLVRPSVKKSGAARFMSEALDVAESQVGVRESPKNSNRGPEVERYLASVGLDGGYAWCSAFVYWCSEQAAVNRGLSEVPLVRTAWTPSIWSWAKKKNLGVKPDDVLNQDVKLDSGCLFLLHGVVSGRARVKHVGFVVSSNGGFIETIEGNTNKSGSREGGGVYRLTRKINSVYRFVNYGA